MAITPYSGTVPNRLSAGDNEVYATQVYNWLIYLDGAWVSTVNSTEVNINNKEASVVAKEAIVVANAATATAKAAEALASANIAAQSAIEAEAAVASLPVGTLNDAIITLTNTYSAVKIESLLGGIDVSPITTPTITSPTTGAINFTGAVTATYTTSASYVGVQDWVRWEAATDAAFTAIVDSYEGTSNLLSWTPSIGLALTVVYVRVKQGSDGHRSSYSPTISVTTPDVFINTPTMTVTGTPSSVTAAPTLTTSAFSVYNGTDTHKSTDWIVTKVSDGTTVWASMGNTTNKTSITMPSGILVVSTAYVFSARHNGATYGGSAFVQVSGTTKSAFTVGGNEIAKITASDKAANDYFGYSVSLSSDGTTLAVGAFNADPSGVSNAGACYIYKYNGTSWVETKITASDKAANDYFGWSVSLSSDGTTLAVGAYAADPSGVSDAGACYIYKYNGSSWVETKITASDKAASDYFGQSVSLSSDGATLAVGANYADPSGIANAGACYVYK